MNLLEVFRAIYYGFKDGLSEEQQIKQIPLKNKNSINFKLVNLKINDDNIVCLNNAKEVVAPMIAISGKTGSGKTSLSKKIISTSIKGGVKFLIIDSKRDYINVRGNFIDEYSKDNKLSVENPIKKPIGFNPLAPFYDDDTPMIIAYRFVDIIKSLFPILGKNQFSDLKSVIIDVVNDGNANINSLLETLNEKKLSGGYITIIEALDDFNVFTDENISFKEWFEKSENGTVIDVSKLHKISIDAYNAITATITSYLSKYALELDKSSVMNEYREIKYGLVIDEAKNILENKNRGIIDITTMGRDIGIMCILGTQQEDHFSQSGYNYLKDFPLIFHGKSDSRDLDVDNFYINIVDEVQYSIPYYKIKKELINEEVSNRD